jgi:hypothetical protein
VENTLKKISQGSKSIRKRDKTEWKIITNIKCKMRTNELVITKADEWKTLILAQELYKQKTKTFIQDNHFGTINNNPTRCYQKEINTKTMCKHNTKRRSMEIHKLESHGPKHTRDNKST